MMRKVKEFLIKKSEEIDFKNTFKGLYFLVSNQRVVYIGSSGNVPYRLEQHRALKRFNVDVGYFLLLPRLNDETLKKLECKLIKLFQPDWNSRKSKKEMTERDYSFIINTLKIQ